MAYKQAGRAVKELAESEVAFSLSLSGLDSLTTDKVWGNMLKIFIDSRNETSDDKPTGK